MKPFIKKIFDNPFGRKIKTLRREIKMNFFSKKSYSQAGEDLILNLLLDEKQDGFYVDIGAYHPIYLSNTYLFYKKGWSGIQVEPNKKRAKLFKQQRPQTITLSVGIGSQDSEMSFYLFKEDTLCTFSKESADLHCELGHVLEAVETVSMRPLSKILEQYASGKEVDILSVDVEGYDLEVLKTNDWKKYRPRFIVLETLVYSKDFTGEKLNQAYDPYLESIGYIKVADTYINSIYKDVQNV